MSSFLDRLVTEPTTMFTVESGQGDAFLNIFGSVALEVHCPDGNTIEIGIGSIGAIKSIRYYSQPNIEKPVLVVGRFSEFSDCEIIIGGKHSTRTLASFSFSSTPFVAQEIIRSGIMASIRPQTKPIRIGSGCVFSRHVLVVPGASVGHGSIIGAGVVLHGLIPDFSIVAGNSTSAIRNRFDPLMTDMCNSISLDTLSFAGMAKLVSTVHVGTDLAAVDWDTYRDYNDSKVVFDCTVEPGTQKIQLRNLLGVRKGDTLVNPSALPTDFLNYLKQATDVSKKQLSWVADPFSYFNVS